MASLNDHLTHLAQLVKTDQHAPQADAAHTAADGPHYPNSTMNKSSKRKHLETDRVYIAANGTSPTAAPIQITALPVSQTPSLQMSETSFGQEGQYLQEESRGTFSEGFSQGFLAGLASPVSLGTCESTCQPSSSCAVPGKSIMLHYTCWNKSQISANCPIHGSLQRCSIFPSP